MNKPTTFIDYWDDYSKNLCSQQDYENLEKCWNFAMDQAALICNNTDEKWEDSSIIDKDVIIDIAAEIESLKSN